MATHNLKFKQPPKSGSYAQDFLNARQQANAGPPSISALAANSVSNFRKEIMANEVEQGLYRDGNHTNLPASVVSANGSSLGNVTASSGSRGFSKTAQMATADGSGHLGANFGGGSFGGMGNSLTQIGQIYSPLWLTSNLNLPRDRATINAWCRAFFALNPFVNNAIQLHSTYPISKLAIRCPHPEIQKFFDDMIEELDLMNVCVQIAQEYNLLGEAFVYAEYDRNRGKWSRIMLQNPDYMIVKRTVIANEPIIMLRPDENLKRVINSNRANDIEQRKQLSQNIIEHVRRGENIPLDNFECTHLARKISPYEIRGTGLPVCIFRQLMLMDKLREAQFVQADTMVNPLTLVKIGSNGPDGLHPTPEQLEAWRAIFEATENNPSAKIFSHSDIAVERVGYGQGIYDVNPNITQLIKEIYIGLQVPQVIMDGGGDVTYGNAGITIDVLRQRYMQFRNMMSIFLKRKIFAPISQIQGFYNVVNGKKQLIVPEIEWNHMSLFDAGDYINTLVTLTTPSGEGALPRASNSTLYRSLGLEWEDEQRKIRKEAIQAEIYRKEEAALKTMTLNELRSLDEEEDIKEPAPNAPGAGQPDQEVPVPGETGGGLPNLPPPPAPETGGLPGLPPTPSTPPPAPPAP